MIYVDNAGIPATVTDQATAQKYASRWSHLTADTEDELHAFAARIGLQRRWFQTCKSPMCRPPCAHWHYDVTAAKRRQAVAAGAREIDLREWQDIVRARREAARAEGGAS